MANQVWPLLADHALSKWSSNYLQGVQPYKNPRAPLQIANWMRNAGFTEVESKLLVLPMCGWSSSKFPYHDESSFELNAESSN